MSEQSETMLSDMSRAGIAKAMDALLPGTDVLPSATEVQAHGELLDRVLAADPKLAPIVRSCGDRALAAGTVTLAKIQEWCGADEERLVFALHAAYYRSDEVRRRLNYPGQGRYPVAEATPDQMCTPELIAPVIARGSIYVPTPEGV